MLHDTKQLFAVSLVNEIKENRLILLADVVHNFPSCSAGVESSYYDEFLELNTCRLQMADWKTRITGKECTSAWFVRYIWKRLLWYSTIQCVNGRTFLVVQVVCVILIDDLTGAIPVNVECYLDVADVKINSFRYVRKDTICLPCKPLVDPVFNAWSSHAVTTESTVSCCISFKKLSKAPSSSPSSGVTVPDVCALQAIRRCEK